MAEKDHRIQSDNRSAVIFIVAVLLASSSIIWVAWQFQDENIAMLANFFTNHHCRNHDGLHQWTIGAA